jgi:hypothetical protein
LGLKQIVGALLRQDKVVENLQNLEHPARQAAISHGYDDVAELLEEYIDINLYVDTTDDATMTTMSSITPDMPWTSSTDHAASRTTSAFSSDSARTDKESPVSFEIWQEPLAKRIIPKAPEPPQKEDISLSILAEALDELSADAKPFEKLPDCFTHDKYLRACLKQMSENFKAAGMDGFIYGSAHHKLRPNDIDILMPASWHGI